MEIRHVSYVLEFLNVGFDVEFINKSLKTAFHDSFKDGLNDSLQGWEIVFRATYSNGRNLLVSKNKFGNYTSDKIKEITVVIPIPTEEVVPWGVNHGQQVFDLSHYDKLLNNFWAMEVDYGCFSNRSDYIIRCMEKAINLCLEKGYTVNGVKLRKS